MLENRRKLRMARIIKEVVSDAIQNHLSDPRIQGFVSVTEVELTPDLRNASVHLSFIPEDTAEITLRAIKHARGHIQTLLAHELNIRFCPIISFHEDLKYKKAGETLKIIEKIADELHKKDAEQNIQDQDTEDIK
ncbi:Ribosome-binding factor A [Limihaloglobus sulfuriphilus]|uniref:Ribosome-binding factor A n=1 Tax=Limihaloglobus sulfuriphilus TaxID=1851148 RepID=A0A1Q2MDJ2_9BACT|nr:30S ribosome-binding factor RbfA [Limihaloglobus sulfuriphilus]AQQ70618.1 Ribosome-binding factor A [Limihaloglobus sulfuriphilus]